MNHFPSLFPKMDRRSFVIGSVAVGGGLALGLELPFGRREARAAVGGPEVNAWVVIRPDETVLIRVAKSEMGQGTITGLAQLVAEELECDWSKVRFEYPTPGERTFPEGRRSSPSDAHSGCGQHLECSGVRV